VRAIFVLHLHHLQTQTRKCRLWKEPHSSPESGKLIPPSGINRLRERCQSKSDAQVTANQSLIVFIRSDGDD
jgi:hypothetical protein